MKQHVYGWQTSEKAQNALSALLGGQEAPFVPVAPLFVDCPFRGYVDQRLCGLWEERLEREGKEVEVDFETYARSRFEVMCEIIDRFNSPPCWVTFPWTARRSEVEGSRVGHSEGLLVWIDADGTASPLRDKLRSLDRRPGPWPMNHPPNPPLEEVVEKVERLLEERVADREEASRKDTSVQALRDQGSLTVWDWLQERYRGAMPFYITGPTPSGLIQDTMGFENMMRGFLDTPELVHQISRLGMPTDRAHWRTLREAGVEVMHLSEYSWGNQISPAIYREFIAPYTREMIDYFRELGFKVLLYVMGDIRPVLDQIADYPFDALAIEEGRKGYQLDVGEIRRVLDDDRVLFGNVPMILIEQGPPEDILAEVRRQISATGENGRFVVSTGEPIPPWIQPERVRFFCDSTRLI